MTPMTTARAGWKRLRSRWSVKEPATTTDTAPVLGFVGIHAGTRTDRPPSQDETVAAFFRHEGFDVRCTSSVKAPWLRTLDQVVDLLRWRKVDLVIVAVFSGRSFWIADLATMISRLHPRRKVVLFLHGGGLPAFAESRRRWMDRVFARADRIIAPSQYLVSAFAGRGFDIRVVPNAISIGDYPGRARSQARPAVLWMRAFHDIYGPITAVEVMARLLERAPEARMTMAGVDHGLLDATIDAARRLGVAEHVDFVGYLDGEAKTAAFADHDFFLNTNKVDNLPVSVLEAAASGLVPIAHRVGGISFMLHDGIDGRVVDPDDVVATAEAIARLLANPDEFALLSRGAQALAEGFSWDVVRQRWRAELSTLLPDHDWSALGADPPQAELDRSCTQRT